MPTDHSEWFRRSNTSPGLTHPGMSQSHTLEMHTRDVNGQTHIAGQMWTLPTCRVAVGRDRGRGQSRTSQWVTGTLWGKCGGCSAWDAEAWLGWSHRHGDRVGKRVAGRLELNLGHTGWLKRGLVLCLRRSRGRSLGAQQQRKATQGSAIMCWTAA